MSGQYLNTITPSRCKLKSNDLPDRPEEAMDIKAFILGCGFDLKLTTIIHYRKILVFTHPVHFGTNDFGTKITY